MRVFSAPVRVAVDVQNKGRTTEPKTRVLGRDEVAQEVKAAIPVRAPGGVGEMGIIALSGGFEHIP